jgi:Phage integrase, N-terminal SAM-like domain
LLGKLRAYVTPRVTQRASCRFVRGVTFSELTAEWLEYLQHERGAKPSTLSDYRYLLAEPGAPHRRGKGKSPGTIMAAFGERPAAKITTREIAAYLRKLDSQGVSARSVNKHRQVLSAIFGSACRADTHGLPSNPVTARPSAANRRRRCSTSTSPRRSRRSPSQPPTDHTGQLRPV